MEKEVLETVVLSSVYIISVGLFIVGLIRLILKQNEKPHWYHNDPVYYCKLYKDKGCAHVDGPLCDFPECEMNDDYK